MPLVRKSASVTATPAGNTPALLPNLALWLDGADSSTLISDGAASFASASNQYLSVANNATISPATGLMVGCWVNLSTLPGTGQNYRLISRWLVTGNQRSYDLTLTDISGLKRFKFYGSTNGTTVIEATSGQVPSTSTWYFVVGWWDGSNLYCSVNGGTPGSAALASMFNGTGALWLGAREGGADYLNGVMDSAFILKTPTALGDGTAGSLAKSLIDYLYNGGAGRRSSDFINSALYSASGAVSFWDLDERSGTRNDRIGSNHLTNNNSVGYAAGIASGSPQFDGDPISQWNDKSGNSKHVLASTASKRPSYQLSGQNSLSAIKFDGVDDALATSTNIGISGSSPRTLFTVAKEYNPGSNITSIAMFGALTSTNAHMHYFANGNIYLDLYGANYTYTSINSGSYSVLASLINSSQKVVAYRNGVLIGTTSGIANTTDSTFLVGYTNFGAGYYLNSSIAEIILYKQNLLSSQRQLIEQYLIQKWMGTPVVTLTASSTIQHLEWSDVGFATRYEVYYRVTGSNTWTLYTTTTSLWAAVQDLTVGVSYDFRVDAVWSV
jgi:hypothetical protein